MSARVAEEVRPAEAPLRGTAHVPGDKSISHRMAVVAGVAEGTSRIAGFSDAGDCRATLRCLESLGVPVDRDGDAVLITGRGWEGLRDRGRPLDCERSGTTMRLLTGVLAGRPFRSVLAGSPQLLRRPMDRVAHPLRRMGADVRLAPGGRAPISVRGGALRGISHTLPVASAQVKSAVLLAGLQADERTTVVEPATTRDHIERLLRWTGAGIEEADGPDGRVLTVRAATPEAFEARVPGDPSSAAPLLAAAALVPGSDVAVRGVGLNPTRTAFFGVLARMGAPVTFREEDTSGPEPAGEIRVGHGPLRATVVGPAEVPLLIDELPLVAVVAAAAEGTTVVRGAAELRVKESDRIAGVVRALRALGVEAEEAPSGFAVHGPATLAGGAVDALGDHRLAMALAVAALVARGPVRVAGMAAVGDSFSGFPAALEGLRS